MKKIFLTVFVGAFLFIACNSNTNKAKQTKIDNISNIAEQMYACSMHPEVTGKKGDICSKCGMALTVPVTNIAAPPESTLSTENKLDTTKPVSVVQQVDFSIKEIVADYLKLKNALTKDNSKGAAEAANSLLVNLASADGSNLSASQKKNLTDITDDAKEHAEHIGSNAGKLEHQREHFEMLSKDIYDLVKAFGGGQVLYKDFCPMYNNNKGAFWVSETKNIQNPYLGKAMPTCGTVKEEIK
jgi:Protein of unknown function (DUF3347)/Heavy metal binding domain